MTRAGRLLGTGTWSVVILALEERYDRLQREAAHLWDRCDALDARCKPHRQSDSPTRRRLTGLADLAEVRARETRWALSSARKAAGIDPDRDAAELACGSDE